MQIADIVNALLRGNPLLVHDLEQLVGFFSRHTSVRKNRSQCGQGVHRRTCRSRKHISLDLVVKERGPYQATVAQHHQSCSHPDFQQTGAPLGMQAETGSVRRSRGDTRIHAHTHLFCACGRQGRQTRCGRAWPAPSCVPCPWPHPAMSYLPTCTTQLTYMK